LAYIVGEREFHGLVLQVGPAVLVPRPETELLVDWALERLAAIAGAPRVADLGTGSGAIALAVKQACPRAAVCASDASAEALALARGNAARHRLDIEWLNGDWWAPYASRRFALALANPPYVAAADPHLADLRHEPQAALTAGVDGLAALRRIVADAPAHLLPGAWLLLEHGHDQAHAVRGLLDARGYGPAETRPDLAGLPRCTGAAWPGAK
jgi:release factor glutamine methyltransferase